LKTLIISFFLDMPSWGYSRRRFH